MAKKYAIQTYKRDKDGTLKATLIDAKTGEAVSAKSAKDYDIVTSTDYDSMTLTGQLPGAETDTGNTDNKTPSAPKYPKTYGGRTNAERGSNSSTNKNSTTSSKRDFSNNFGYKHKPGWVSATSLIPGPAGLAAKAVNLGWDLNNKEAKKSLTSIFGEDKTKKSFGKKVKDFALGPDGSITTDVGGKLQKVSVDPTDMSSLTPMEGLHRKEGFAKLANPAKYATPSTQATVDMTGLSTAEKNAERLSANQNTIGKSFKADPNAGTPNISGDVNPTGVTSPDQIANADYNSLFDPADPQGRMRSAFMDTIAKHESQTYNSLYNPSVAPASFGDFSQHPNIGKTITSGPNKGKQTHVAGGFQFQPGTWNPIAKQYNLPDFSPASQKIGAWHLADNTFKAKTGMSLDEALSSGDPKQIAAAAAALSGQWTSLPSGIEQGTTTNKFVTDYQNALRPDLSPEEAYGINPSMTQDLAAAPDFSKLSFGQYATHYYDKVAKTADFASEAIKAAGNVGKSVQATSFGSNRPATGFNSSNISHINSGASNPSQMGGTGMGFGFGKTNPGTSIGNFGRADTPSSGRSIGGFNSGKTSSSLGSGASNPSQMGGTGMSSGLGNSNKDKSKSQGPSGGGYGGWGGPH